MLIKIDKSLVDNQQNAQKWSDEIIFTLENLALAAREGKHFVIAERETLKKIIECPDLNRNQKAIYKTLLNKSAEFREYLSIVSKYIEICQPCPYPHIDSSSGKDIIKVSPKFFDDSETIQKTILLCENSEDTIFYEQITNFYRFRQKIKGIRIDFEPRGGGGSTIADEYNNIQQEKKRLCLCIVDSDKIAPHSSLGNTAKKIQEIDNSDEIKTELLILDVRDIENLIPNSILSEIIDGNNDREKAWTIFNAIQNSHVSEIRNFLDIKEGTLLKTIINNTSQETKLFWEDKFIEILNFNTNIDQWCVDNWQCQKKTKCDCYISLGFGKKTLDDTNSWFNSQTNLKVLSSMIDQSLYLEWERIGKKIMNWCLAQSPIRA